MNILKPLTAFLLSGLFLLTLSCGLNLRDGENVSEFAVEGFINPDTYQVILVFPPEKDVTGHVNQRDSAYYNAKKNLNDAVVANLVKYCINKKTALPQDGRKPADDAESALKQRFYQYLNYGRVAFEYYNENNSVYLGYRIEKKGLKYEIESVSLVTK